MVSLQRSTAIQLITCVSLALLLAGCPRKLVEVREKVVKVQGDCSGSGPAPSIKSLVAVALVTSGDKGMTVLAGTNYAAVVGVGDKVGTEGATVAKIKSDSVIVTLADGSSHGIPVTTVLPAPAQPKPGATDAPQQPATANADNPEAAAKPAGNKNAEAYARWRISVMQGVSRGYGVPLHALLALSLALSDHSRPTVANALNNLGWSNLSSMGKAYLTRVAIKDGQVAVEGVAPSKRTYDEILRRLRSANPLVSSVKSIQDGPINSGHKFSLTIRVPLVKSNDIAKAGANAASGELAAALQDPLKGKLLGLAAKLAPSNSLPSFEKHLRTLRQGYGLEVSSVTRQADIVEGYLGMASFAIQAQGTTNGLLDYLAALRKEVSARRGAIVDPLVIEGKRVQMVIRVPYVTAKEDVRQPLPGAIITPRLSNQRWMPAKNLPLSSIRDPFQR